MAESSVTPVLMHPDAKTGEVVLYHPDTGVAIPLHDASNDQLADFKKALAEWRARAAAAERLADHELIRRMDAEALWTIRAGGYKLEGQSPAPRRVVENPEKLKAALLRLAAEGEVSAAAVEAALPEVPASVAVKVGPLGKLEKLGGRVERTIRRYRKEAPKGERRVKLLGA